MKYKIDTYDDFLNLKPEEVYSLATNYVLYTEEEHGKILNFMLKFNIQRARLEKQIDDSKIINEDNIDFSKYTNREMLAYLQSLIKE